jgi:hypothetical protein
MLHFGILPAHLLENNIYHFNKKTMKNFILTVIISIIFFNLNAQDIIVKNDKTEIKAKIEELTETTIKYKKIEMLDGPSYNINKRDVFMIIYKNGTKEYMETIPESSKIINSNGKPNDKIETNSQKNDTDYRGTTSVASTSGNHEKFIQKGKFYTFEGVEIKKSKQLMSILQEKGSFEVQELAASSSIFKTMAYVGALGGGLGIMSTLSSSTGQVRISSPGLFIGSIVLIGGGLLSVTQYGKRINKATKLFNQEGHNPKVSFRPTFNKDQIGNHVGLSIGF